jgi:two-component system, OmpR family, phosphate regulon sensor histidine kinase PhoR
MFARLLCAFVGFALVTSALVAVAILRGVGGDFSPREVLSIVLVAGLLAVAPAWVFARGFVRPFREMQAGAERIARGELSHRIFGGAWFEAQELAHSFNEMSRRLVEQIDRLEAERQHLRAILGGMAEGVVGVGPRQRVLFANAAAGRMLDFDPGSAVGRPLYDVARQPAVQTVLDRALHSGKLEREEMELKELTSRHLSIHVAPLAEHGSPGAVLVLNDTTELRRLERLRQEFVANVSHELKTPLAVMKACVETLLDGAVEDPEVRGSFLQQIAEGADRLHALILDLLSLARIESGDEAFEFGPVPVRDVVMSCLERQRPRAEAKGMHLEAAPPAETVDVWADEEALGQILDNLLDNAVKYTQPGGTVRVRWSTDGDALRLSVEDNGPGISERDLNRIFERFYRVDKARSRELGGTGLGLSIVKHLAQAMHGTVTAYSQLERGTTLTVSLPTSSRVELKVS